MVSRHPAGQRIRAPARARARAQRRRRGDAPCPAQLRSLEAGDAGAADVHRHRPARREKGPDGRSLARPGEQARRPVHGGVPARRRVGHATARHARDAGHGARGGPAGASSREGLEPVLHRRRHARRRRRSDEAGPASAWFNLGRQVVGGEETSPLGHAVSAADLCSGISAVVDLRAWSFINADLTVLFWRVPRPPWILLAAKTHVGDRGTGVARGMLSDVEGPFGSCEQTLLFDRRR